jgi:predicted SAM-dependent methyltransferase
MPHIIKKLINKLLNLLGYRIVKYHYRYGRGLLRDIYNKNDINLNIGSGGKSYPYFINLDLPSDHYKNSQKNNNYISYNLSKDNLPFENETVQNIFCSHVIEHVTDEDTLKLFSECIRVLKIGGTLRITCPDSKFLFEVSSFQNEFWHRTYSKFETFYEKKMSVVLPFDFFIREISTNKLKFNSPFYKKIMAVLPFLKYDEVVKELTKDNKQDITKPGNHINFFDFEKIKNILKEVCTKKDLINYKIIHSKPHGSISMIMSEDLFDQVEYMSVFVDFRK